MKQLVKQFSAIVMAMMVIFSTLSFTVSEHYCGAHLVDSSLFSKAESYGMELQRPSPTKDCSVNKDNCCSDVLTHIEGQSELKTDLSNLSFNQQVFVASFVYSSINLFEGLEENIVPFKYYSPPLIVKDIQVLDNIFLI